VPNIGLAEILIIVIAVGGFVLWIAALVDAIKVPEDSLYRAGNKLVWVLVIVLTGFIGALIYYAVGKPSRQTTGLGPPPPA
jgi:phospholipase D-like protein